MKLSPRTKVALVTLVTVAFIGILLFFSPNSTSVEGNAPSSSGTCVTKQFVYEWLNPDVDWKEKDWYIEGLDVYLWIEDCMNFVGMQTTNEYGQVTFCGVPEGWYVFTWTWNGQDMRERVYLCCNKEFHWFVNELPPNVEEGAFSYSFKLKWHLQPRIFMV